MTVPLPWLGFAGLVGAVWGSFLGVLVSRVPAGAALTGRSRCDACGRALGPLDLVPIVSWSALRGRCRTCGAAVSARWTAIEVAAAGLAVLAAWSAGEPWTAVLLGSFFGVLLALTLIDLEHRRLPDAIVGPTAIAAAAFVVIGWLLGAPLDPSGAAVGGLAFGGSLLAVALLSRGGMGMGDVKFAAVIGLVIGAVDLPSVGVAAGAAILLGGLAALVALARGAGRRTALPFGPMLAAGAVIAGVAGPGLADAYVGLLR